MKKIFYMLAACIMVQTTQAQDASVEKSIFGVQTGFLGIWVHNEVKLANQFALRTEVGLDAGLFINSDSNIDGLALIPALTLEPRWYINLNRRQEKSKRIDGNSGTFISLKTTYHPDWFVITSENKNSYTFISDISIIPTIGIRRNIGKHFNYEVGGGIGYVRYLDDDYTRFFDASDVAANLHLRIGYRF
ncbi:MAG: hypothetical protein AAF617_04060 [Bacteroidota bacterium]